MLYEAALWIKFATWPDSEIRGRSRSKHVAKASSRVKNPHFPGILPRRPESSSAGPRQRPPRGNARPAPTVSTGSPTARLRQGSKKGPQARAKARLGVDWNSDTPGRCNAAARAGDAIRRLAIW